jgi:Protein of unknown function (DUF1761)
MPPLPWLAVAVAAFVFFVLGGLWYAILGKAWLAALGKTRADMNPRDPKPFFMAAVGSFVNAVALAWIIQATGCETVTQTAALGTLLGVGVVFAAATKHYAFSGWSARLLAIDLGHDVVGFTAMGIVLGVMK